jgi:hypothetical protein
VLSPDPETEPSKIASIYQFSLATAERFRIRYFAERDTLDPQSREFQNTTRSGATTRPVRTSD